MVVKNFQLSTGETWNGWYLRLKKNMVSYLTFSYKKWNNSIQNSVQLYICKDEELGKIYILVKMIILILWIYKYAVLLIGVVSSMAEPGYRSYGYNNYGGHGIHSCGYGGSRYGCGYQIRYKREANPGYGYRGYGSANVYVHQTDYGYGYPESYSYGYNIHGGK